MIQHVGHTPIPNAPMPCDASRSMIVKKFCDCGERSVPSLKKGVALCPHHYSARIFGKDWADYVYGKSVCIACGKNIGKKEGIYRGGARHLACD